MLVAPLLFIGNALLSSRCSYPLQDDVLRRGLLRPDINEEIQIFSPPTAKSKSNATADRPICSHPGCATLARSRGLCYTHRYPCAIETCKKQAQVEGYCIEHAKKYKAEAYDRLRSNRSCAIVECEKRVQAGGYCIEHSKRYDPEAYNEYLSNKMCKVSGCMKRIQAEGYCSAHFKEHDPVAHKKWLSERKRCKVEGCPTTAEIDGYCAEHAQQYALGAYRKFRLRTNERHTDRWENDPHFKLGVRFRDELKRVGTSYKGKLILIGCSVDQFRQYFEHNHFQEAEKEWMSWDNWGGKRCHKNRSWELDHIMPVSSFDLTNEEELKKCFHWSNLQPLSWQDNMEKRDSIPKDFKWCIVKERWMWSENSGKVTYELRHKHD